MKQVRHIQNRNMSKCMQIQHLSLLDISTNWQCFKQLDLNTQITAKRLLFFIRKLHVLNANYNKKSSHI